MNHSLRILLGALLAFSLALPGWTVWAATWPESEDGAASAGFTEEGMEELDAAMRRIVADQDVAGMVWLLVRNGKVATFDHAGIARIDDDAPMTRDSLFRIYSMTKPVTGVALMMLHEEGLWEFDDPVSKHVPEFADLQLMVSYDDEGNAELAEPSRHPNMRELLNHSAGFGYGLSGQDPVNNAFRESRVLASSDLDQLIDRVAEIPILFEPGEEWYYSVAVDIQGYIVQKLSGMRFGEFLEQRMFLPLGMNDTRFYVQEQDRPRFAEVHNWDAERGALVQRPHRADRPSYLDPTRLESGGGGLVSSTHDYARFLQMLVNEGELEGVRILTPESVRIMRTNSLRDELLMGGGAERSRRTANRASSSCGVPAAVTRPASNTRTRSAAASSAARWVTATLVIWSRSAGRPASGPQHETTPGAPSAPGAGASARRPAPPPPATPTAPAGSGGVTACAADRARRRSSANAEPKTMAAFDLPAGHGAIRTWTSSPPLTAAGAITGPP